MFVIHIFFISYNNLLLSTMPTQQHRFALLAVSSLAFAATTVTADWPAGPSQYCKDDAGPAYGDYDKPYWLKTQATPVIENGACPSPLAKSCAADGIKFAHLASTPQCGKKGWFCRIIEEKGWVNKKYNDKNFGHCNTTYADETDQDGHCHGSDVDNVYPWWIRDHWHRGYTGTLYCCCDYWSGLKGLVNRCDYRKEVKPNKLSKCRDANEEHNSGYEGKGDSQCDAPRLPNPNFKEPVGSSIAAVADQCWTVAHFADPEAVTSKNDFPLYSDKNDFPDSTSSVCGVGQKAELMSGGTCPSGSHVVVDEKDACEDVAEELGLNDVGATKISKSKRPRGCYFDNKRLWFNTKGKSIGNGARKSLCCTTSQDEEDDTVCGGGNEPQMMKNGVCPSGSHSIIANIDTCEDAAAILDLDDGSATVISKSNRPKGCHYRKNKLWYNKKGKSSTSKARKAICCEK